MSAVHLEVLRDARAQIESERETFVCLAIKYHHGRRREGEEGGVAQELAHWARGLLGGHYTPESWLEEHQGVREVNDLPRTPEIRAKLRVTRLAWIDWMIDHWSKHEC